MRSIVLASAAVLLLSTASCNKLKAGADGGTDGDAPAAASGPLGASLAFLSGFEGEIDGFTKDNKPGAQQVPLTLFIKSSKVRFQVPEGLAKGAGPGSMGMGGHGYIIFDSTAKKLYIVDDAQKQAIVFDLNKSTIPGLGSGGPGGMPGAPGKPGAPSGPATKVTKTGKTDTVAGYKCEYWDVASDHKEATVCVADDGPSWLSLPLTGIPTERAWMLELMDGKHFPLRFIGYEKDGTTEQARVEVTKIDKKSLPDSEFQVPAGYKIIDLAQMMQGLGMPGGPGGMPGGMPIPHPPTHH